jgi:hypothetical protein
MPPAYKEVGHCKAIANPIKINEFSITSLEKKVVLTQLYAIKCEIEKIKINIKIAIIE